MDNLSEEEVLRTLENLGYNGPLRQKIKFAAAIEGGAGSIEYTKLVHYLTNELRHLCSVDEQVNMIDSTDDSASFLMELGSFLKELGCPHSSLMEGNISERLVQISDRLLLIEYLATELMAAQILRENNPEKKIELRLMESTQAADLREILQTLGFPKPPPNITMKGMMQKVIPTLDTLIKKAGSDLLGSPLFTGTLSDKQWHQLHELQQNLHNNYFIRREMLLKRLDCTIQSFEWSNKTRGKEHTINKIFKEKYNNLEAEPHIIFADLLAARQDLAVIEKTSSSSVRRNTKSAVNNVIIGQVPDRGGRTSEHAPPPPEMPPWQQRQSGPFGGGGGRGFGGGAGRGFGGGGGRGFGGGGGRDFGGGGGARGGQRGAGNYNRGSYSNSGNGYTASNNAYNSNSSYSTGGYQRGVTSQSQSTVGYSSSPSISLFKTENTFFKDFDTSLNFTSAYPKPFDSAGSYSSGYDNSRGSSSYERNAEKTYHESKRAKTFDHFQHSKPSYADQYVQESQHNRQFNSREDKGDSGRGRSNYNRGGRY